MTSADLHNLPFLDTIVVIPLKVYNIENVCLKTIKLKEREQLKDIIKSSRLKMYASNYQKREQSQVMVKEGEQNEVIKTGVIKWCAEWKFKCYNVGTTSLLPSP